MKILFVCGVAPPDNSATAVLLKKLTRSLQDIGVEVDFLTYKQSFLDGDGVTGVSKLFKAEAILRAPSKIMCMKDLFWWIYAYVDIKLNAGKRIYNKKRVEAICKKLEEINLNNYDVVIGVCAYYEIAEAMLRMKKRGKYSPKFCLYQVDPLTENINYCKIKDKAQEYEKELFGQLDMIFTTPINYKKKKTLGWDLSKVAALELPIEIFGEREYCKRDEIICVFAGYLYGNIRDASFTLELFSRFSDKNIKLVLLGSGQEELVEEYKVGKLNGRLFPLGQKSPKDCDKILQEADVLVNIGNRVNDYLPSKLMHYIGFGKAILNIVASQGCPSLSYMDKYELSLSVMEQKELSLETVSQVEKWIKENYRKRMSGDNIKLKFSECFSNYIAEKIVCCLQ